MPHTRRIELRSIARIALGIGLALAGVAHLGFAREDFQAQVPDWVALNKDFVVIASGVLEIVLGLSLLVARKSRALVGLIVGAFFIAIFPGNLSQFIDGDDAFGLNSDAARRNRLFFQPVLVAWAWWCTNARSVIAHRRTDGLTVRNGAPR